MAHLVILEPIYESPGPAVIRLQTIILNNLSKMRLAKYQDQNQYQFQFYDIIIKSAKLQSLEMKGKVAIITASSTGIGKGIALRLAQDGCSVIVSSRNEKHINETVDELKKEGFQAFGIVCHVGKKQDRANLINKTIQKYGRIDYIVANAAVSTQTSTFLQADEAQIRKMWDINFMSTFLLIQEALPHLRKQKQSSIVILSSYTAYEPTPIIGHYAITKTALVSLTKILARQLMEDDIRVNAIAPGLIKTKFSSILWEQKQAKSAKYMGVKRLGIPEDIANVAHFLLSNQSAYMTGQCLAVVGKPLSRL